MTTMTQTNLSAIGLHFDNWQDAVEAAIASNQLSVTGEIRGGQLVQFNDASGAQLNILAVEPFSTYVGFDALTQVLAHVDMLNDVVALCEIVDPFGKSVTTVTTHLAQGPLLADEPVQRFQQMSVTALANDMSIYDSADDIDGELGSIHSAGAQIVASGTAQTPDATATLSGRVLEARRLRNQLTGQQFIHAVIDAQFPLDVCIAADDDTPVPTKGQFIAGDATLTASIVQQTGGCGCGSGGCGCGGH